MTEAKVIRKELSSLEAAGDLKGDHMDIVLLRKELSICAILFPLLILGFMLSCTSGDETTAIRELIKQGATLGEKHDISGLINLTRDDFVALPANLDRRGDKKNLWPPSVIMGVSRSCIPFQASTSNPTAAVLPQVSPFLSFGKMLLSPN